METVLLDVNTGKAGLHGVEGKTETAATERRVSFNVQRIRLSDEFGAEAR